MKRGRDRMRFINSIHCAFLRITIFGSIAIFAISCTVGPTYQQPDSDVTFDYINQSGLKVDTNELNWWTTFNDEQLHRLINTAMARETDMKIAKSRLDEARAVRALARSSFYPAIQTNADYTSYEASIAAPGALGQLVNIGLIDRTDEVYNLGIDTSWELDFFGGTRRKTQSASRSLQAFQADYEATILSLIAEVASAYFEFMGIEKQLKYHQRQLELRQQIHALIVRKNKLGLSSKVDVLQSQVQLSQLTNRRHLLQASRNASLYRLGLVSTLTPIEITEQLTKPATTTLPELIAIGKPADLLKRRPDIIAAERRLAAAYAEVGVARAEYFPKLVINAQYAFEAANISDIGSNAARTTGFVPNIQWPIFAGNQLNANYKVAKARVKAAEATYEGVLLNAIIDAETRLSYYIQSTKALVSSKNAQQAAQQTTNVNYKLNEQGLIELQAVLTTELQQLDIEQQLANQEAQTFINLVQVYKALGGSW